jgi:FtsZ-interacting cell division protein ZipA
LSYAGMTGEGFWTASRETAELFRANRARNIRDQERSEPRHEKGAAEGREARRFEEAPEGVEEGGEG